MLSMVARAPLAVMAPWSLVWFLLWLSAAVMNIPFDFVTQLRCAAALSCSVVAALGAKVGGAPGIGAAAAATGATDHAYGGDVLLHVGGLAAVRGRRHSAPRESS